MEFELTEQRKEVLRAIAETKESIHGSELARILEKTPMAVLKNIQPFVEEKILKSELTHEGGKRLYQFTDKGMAFVMVHTDIDIDTLLDNHSYLTDADQRKQLNRILPNKAVRNLLSKAVSKFALEHNLFDQDGKTTIDRPENRQRKIECGIVAHQEIFRKYKRGEISLDINKWRRVLIATYNMNQRQTEAIENLVNVVENVSS